MIHSDDQRLSNGIGLAVCRVRSRTRAALGRPWLGVAVLFTGYVLLLSLSASVAHSPLSSMVAGLVDAWVAEASPAVTVDLARALLDAAGWRRTREHNTPGRGGAAPSAVESSALVLRPEALSIGDARGSIFWTLHGEPSPGALHLRLRRLPAVTPQGGVPAPAPSAATVDEPQFALLATAGGLSLGRGFLDVSGLRLWLPEVDGGESPTSGDGASPAADARRVPIAGAPRSLPFPPLAGFPRGRLFVSNDPENITAPGLLLAGEAATDLTRLHYWHVNRTGAPLPLVARLENLTGQPVTVTVRGSAVGPMRDEMQAGHVLTQSYFGRPAERTLTIPAYGGITLDHRTLPPGQVAGGLFEVRTSSQGVLVMIFAGSPEGQAQGDSGHGAGIFAREAVAISDQIPTDALYRRWYFLDIGATPQIDARSGSSLDAAYGLLYDITLVLRNPGADAARVELTAMARGGVARGTFLIDGLLVETGLLQPGAMVVLRRLVVPAGGVHTLRVQTIPQAGSYYPIQLSLRPAP